jgi:hypothetical protein
MESRIPIHFKYLGKILYGSRIGDPIANFYAACASVSTTFLMSYDNLTISKY